jgi:hypothetical protein
MAPPKQIRAQHVKSDLVISPKILAKNAVKIDRDDYNQDYKATYDFDDDDDARHINHCRMNIHDEEDNEFDVNENEYTNGALSRFVKIVFGKRTDSDSDDNGCTDDDEDFDSEDVVREENEPNPLFQEDDEVDKCDHQSYEDGDWADENGTDYYIDDNADD